MSVTSKRQFDVRVTPVLGRCDAMSGGEVQQPRGKFFNGGAATPDQPAGRRVVTNITVQKGFDPRGMGLQIRQMLQQMLGGTFTITKTPLDDAGVRAGQPTTYTSCKCVRVKLPDYDEQSDTDPSMIEVEFSVGNIVPG